MPKYILSYRSAKDFDTLADPSALPAWGSFLDEIIAPHVVDPGWPVFEPSVVIGEAGPSAQLGGYSIVTADDLEAAVSMAKSCPVIERRGGVEVGRLAELPQGAPRGTDALATGRRLIPQGLRVAPRSDPKNRISRCRKAPITTV
jgi:hypothetical protein